MNALSTKSFALVASVFLALTTGCAAESESEGEEPSVDLAAGQMKTMGITFKGQGVTPAFCPAGKERFYDLCYTPCPADYPEAHITMCFARCNDGDYFESPGNCKHYGSYIRTQMGGFQTVSNYLVPSRDRGAGTPLVCGPGQTMKNGLCFGAATTPAPAPTPTPAPSPTTTGTPYSAAHNACNHKAGYMWLDETEQCVTIAAYWRYKHDHAPVASNEPDLSLEIGCEVGLNCGNKDTNVHLYDDHSSGFVADDNCVDPGTCFFGK
jgi:hypothetical protein